MRTNLDNPVFLDMEKVGLDKQGDDEVFVKLPSASRYYISNYGRLYSTYRHRLLVPQLYGDKSKKAERLEYKLKTNKGKYKNCKAHKLVAETFIRNPDPLNKKEIHHKKDKFDNYYKNLMWTSVDEHRLLESKTNLYLYDMERGTFRQFRSIQKLCRTAGVPPKRIYNTIYQREPDFKFYNGIDGYEIKGEEYNEFPLYVGVERTGEIELTVFEWLLLGASFIWAIWKRIKDNRDSVR